MAERYIPEHRRTQFKAKNTFKPEELRRRREEQQVEIRKAKREENLAKRRGIGTGENRPGASLGAAPDSDDENPPTESQVSFPVFPFLATNPSSPLLHVARFCDATPCVLLVMWGAKTFAQPHINPQPSCGQLPSPIGSRLWQGFKIHCTAHLCSLTPQTYFGQLLLMAIAS
jgi:hypothetical protein